MTVDRGGLEYPITVENHFSATLKRFNAEVANARRNMDGLVAAQRTFKPQTNQSTRNQANARAQRNSTKALTTHEKALKSIAKEEERKAVAEEKALILAQRGTSSTKTQAAALTIHEKAARALAREVERLNVTTLKNQLAQKLGIDLSKKKAQQLSVEEEVLRRIARAQRNLAITQGLQSKQRGNSGLSAQEEVLKRLAAAEQKLRVTRASASNKRLQELTSEEIVLRRIQVAEQKADVAGRLRRLGRNADGTIIAEIPKKLDAVGTAAKKTNSAIGNLFFTFRRLIGVFAAFFIARKAVQGFNALVQETVRFNAALETANLGMAALVTAAGDVKNAVGLSVPPAEALALAQKEAARQTALLRVEGLRTAATFEELVETFQVAVGPGLAAGLDLDQIRKFTVQVSQAASAIGVPQNQLSEEIRSILSGTIQQRTTRLAAVLGITNEEIRNLKEAGTLAEELNKKFTAFNTAGDESLKTFAAVFANAKDAISQLLGAGGLEYFEAVKVIFQAISDSILLKDDVTGALTPAPGAVRIIQSMAVGLEAAAEEAARLVESFASEDLADGASLFGSSLAAVTKILGRIAEGVVKGLNDIATGVNIVGKAVKAVFGDLLGASLAETVTALTRTATVVLGLVLGVKALGAAWVFLTGVPALVAKMTAGIQAMSLSTQLLTLHLLAMTAVLIASGQILASGIRDVTGLPLTFSQSLQLAWNEIKALTRSGITYVKFAFLGMAELVGQLIVAAFNGVLRASVSLAGSLLESLATFSTTAEKALAGLRGYQEESAKADKQRIADDKESLKLLGERLEAEQQANALLSTAEAVQAQKDRKDAADGILDSTRSYAEFLENLPPVIGRSVRASQQQVEQAKRLAEQNTKANEALAAQDRLLGLTGAAQRQGTAEQRAQAQITESSVVLIREQATLTKQRAALLAKQAKIAAEIEKSENTDALKEIIELTQEIKNLEGDRLALSGREDLDSLAQLRVLEDKISVLKVKGDALLSGIGDKEDLDRASAYLGSIGQIRQVNFEIENGEQKLKTVRQENLAILEKQLTVQARAATQQSLAQKAVSLVRSQNKQAVEEAIQARREGENSNVVARANANARLALLQAQSAEFREQARINLDFLIAQQANVTSEETRLALAEQITEQRRADTQAVQGHTVAIRAAADAAERLNNLSGENGFAASLAQQSKDALAQLPTLYQQTFDLLLGITEAFSAAVSNLIVDAFDPNSDKTALEHLSQFLKQVFQMVLQMLLKIAITKAVLKLGSLLGEAGSSAPVTQTFSKPAAGGSMVVNTFADGGFVGSAPKGVARPSGLPASDTVPAWLTPGETVVKRASTNLYGRDVMRKINEGLLDPRALRALAGTSRNARSRRPSGMGYADGGVVSASAPAAAQGPALAVVVPDQTAAARMFAQGKRGFLRMVRENKSAFNAALS